MVHHIHGLAIGKEEPERKIQLKVYGSSGWDRDAFLLPGVNHVIPAGHRLMVQVQSSWFPLYDRNPQTFVNIHTATERDFVNATHRVHRSGDAASKLRVRVLPAGMR